MNSGRQCDFSHSMVTFQKLLSLLDHLGVKYTIQSDEVLIRCPRSRLPEIQTALKTVADPASSKTQDY